MSGISKMNKKIEDVEIKFEKYKNIQPEEADRFVEYCLDLSLD